MMINRLRTLVAAKIICHLKLKVCEDSLAACISVQRGKSLGSPQFCLPMKLQCLNNVPKIQHHDQDAHIVFDQKNMLIEVNPDFFKQTVLQTIYMQKHKYGLNSIVNQYYIQKCDILALPQNQKVVVEFSSPNIAKPFHAGHLRSTIIGNVVSNIYQALGHQVTRINYLGDWGTQFGLLGVGFQKYGSKKKLEEDAIQHLFDVYVQINKDVENEQKSESRSTSSRTFSQGKELFHQMENGDEEALSLWRTFRDYSIDTLKAMYARLGVTFDVYEYESMYQEKAKATINELKKKDLLLTNKDTGVQYVDLTEFGFGKSIPAALLKSDGSTLYLTRDVAAAIDRYDKYHFDKMHYVVENGQHFHFFQLAHILRKMGQEWSKSFSEDFHIKFGRIEGMSTRKGSVVFLNDILNEATERMMKSVKDKKTTKVGAEEYASIAESLAISAIIIQDLHASRLKNYKFTWDRMLNFKADSGVFLQYAHARLSSLEKNCGVTLNPDCDLSNVQEPEAMQLILHLARYDEVLREAYLTLEPYHIVGYLCTLGHLINAANRTLTVKNQPTKIAEGRLLLFHCAKTVMSNGLKILGISPLDKM